jgi:hypothetical protein
MSKLRITAEIIHGIETRTITLKGQYARTLRALAEAGSKGITALEVSNTWAMRLAHYIHILKREHSLPIRMEWEKHNGAAGPGRHGRYFLDAQASIVANSEFREAA